MKNKTMQQSFEDLHEACANLLYEVAKSFKIIKLVKKIHFLELREWVKKRDK